MITDYLAAEQLIKDRLKAQIADVHVLSAEDLEGVRENSQPSPALQVIYYDDSAEEGARKGKSQRINQTWLVVIVVRNVADKSGVGRRLALGELILQTLNALSGYKLSDEFSELVRVRPPFRITYRNGFAYFPIAFSTNLYFTLE